MPKRKRTDLASLVAARFPTTEVPLDATESASRRALRGDVIGDATDASRRESALAGLHRYFRGQESRQPIAIDAWTLRPTLPIAEMIVLIRTITSAFHECRDADPLPVKRAIDPEGCNWDMPSWADDERSDDCMALVSGAIENLQAKYNLA